MLNTTMGEWTKQNIKSLPLHLLLGLELIDFLMELWLYANELVNLVEFRNFGHCRPFLIHSDSG